MEMAFVAENDAMLCSITQGRPCTTLFSLRLMDVKICVVVTIWYQAKPFVLKIDALKRFKVNFVD